MSIKSFQFEPVFECGRCKKTATKEPTPELFLEKMIETKKQADELGAIVYYSGGKARSVTNHFCGASGSNFFVMPTGQVTSCLEASDLNDPVSEIFFYGRYSTGQFEFDVNKVRYLQSRVVQNLPHCNNCFAKYTCAGDCLFKVHSQGNMFDTSGNTRCEINRGVLLYELAKIIEGGKENDGKNTSIQA